MMGLWSFTTLDVTVDIDDFNNARDRAIEQQGLGDETGLSSVVVQAEVDIDEALEYASVEQLKAALASEDSGYTQDQLRAITDAFAAAVSGDVHTAEALIGRIFDHVAQRQAATDGLHACQRIAA